MIEDGAVDVHCKEPNDDGDCTLPVSNVDDHQLSLLDPIGVGAHLNVEQPVLCKRIEFSGMGVTPTIAMREYPSSPPCAREYRQP